MFFYLSLIDTPEEQSTFEFLYNTYRGLMFYIANEILHDERLAEDAVQEAFLRIIQCLQKFNNLDCHKSRTFTVIIVKHVSIDMYKNRKKNHSLSYDDIEKIVSTDKMVKNAEIIDCILSLPENFSTILMLKYSQGYDYKEIATMLKISEATARKHISRAKAKLAKALEEKEVDFYEK